MNSEPMRPQLRPSERSCDVAVVGAGAVGLTLAIALARSGFDTVLIGPAAQERPGRTVALLEGSVGLLDELGLWREMAAKAAPLAVMRIVDATDSLFRGAPVQFEAAELGRTAFGFNIANADLEAALAGATGGMPHLTRVIAQARTFDFGPEWAAIATEDHGTIRAKLVVAADGRQSLARKMAGIGVRVRDWPQTALTGSFTHQAPHRDVSTEFHTRQGPFTLVPLPGSEAAVNRSSLVWVMTPAEAERRKALPPDAFAREVTTHAARLLGSMTLESGIGAFPITTSVSARLTGSRLVLAGEAAHALPPIGAQGLNLSFRDVADLTACLETARTRNEDPGSPAVLDRYAASREGDVALRTTAVDALNGALLSRFPLSDALRGIGLATLGALGPLRRRAMEEGLVPQRKIPAVSTSRPRLDGTDEHRRSTHRS